ncbi:hypothetical protein [Microcoleus sp. B3-D7]|uniref:hypothetical protein n=1 Tax=Microcoleus sp. B3-D7 TaxID=2818659 RepID=UPI002FD25BC9
MDISRDRTAKPEAYPSLGAMPAAGYANALTRKRRSHSELETYPKCGCDLSIHAYGASHLTNNPPNLLVRSSRVVSCCLRGIEVKNLCL